MAQYLVVLYAKWYEPIKLPNSYLIVHGLTFKSNIACWLSQIFVKIAETPVFIKVYKLHYDFLMITNSSHYNRQYLEQNAGNE